MLLYGLQLLMGLLDESLHYTPGQTLSSWWQFGKQDPTAKDLLLDHRREHMFKKLHNEIL